MSSEYESNVDEDYEGELTEEEIQEYFQNKFEEISPEFYEEGQQDEVVPEDDDEPDQLTQDFVERLIDGMMKFMVVLVGHDLHPYQKPLVRYSFFLKRKSRGPVFDQPFERGKQIHIQNQVYP
jgi:hypothetical protein